MTTDHSVGDPLSSGVRELIGAEVLVIDKDPRVQKGITALLSAANLHVTCVDDPNLAWDIFEKQFFSVVIVDLDTPRPNAGLDTAAGILIASPTSMVVMLTPRKSFDDAVASLRAGAVDIVLKSPESVDYLKDRVMRAVGRSADKRQVDSLIKEVRDLHDQFLKRLMGAERRLLDLEDAAQSRSPDLFSEVICLLVVAGNDALARALAPRLPAGYEIQSAVSGGEALDRCGSSRFHIALVGPELRDLPSSMVVRSLKTQHPDMLVLAFDGPGPDARMEIVESSRRLPLIARFERAEQFLERLTELSEAFRARARERRYIQAFREKHYDFLRKYVALKAKIEQALG